MEVEELKKFLLAEQQGRRKEKQKMEEKMEEEKQKMEEGIWKTTLTEFLSLCHEHLSKSISVQDDKSLSTKGDLSNPKGKLCPDYLQPWEDFLDTQKKTLESFYFVYPLYDMPRVFDSRNFIESQGTKVALRKLASEQDLQNLQYNIEEMQVTQIVEHLKSLDSLRDKFELAGGIEFYNHMNPLSDNNNEVAQRLEAQQLGPPTYRPRPNSICVFTTIEGLNKPA